eukprot:TRINITY_DN15616_c0_g1_i2.p1 TRINITY_DN15616_c0_g1~~TRINITY_DN15616_c0_g1_i2.p1  ORF type:complete len:510 (+),score=80.17 TRINITY_DN15616_c0_g1_i2:31-1530(+)
MKQLLAIRVKDGVFVGNSVAAGDEDFLTLNKVSHIINCAGNDVENIFEPTTHYLTFNWDDKSSTVLFDSPDVVRDVKDFIDEALDVGECVLVNSVDGVNRSSALATAYLMAKYGWCLRSAHDFVLAAHPDTDIRNDFLNQLKRLDAAFAVNKENDILHPDISTEKFCLDNEQWCLRNTYLNSLSVDHQRNADLRRSMQTAVPEPRARSVKKISFNMNTTAPFKRCPEGSILVTKPAQLQHPIESPNGDTCPMGPWELKKSPEQLRIEEERRLQQARERERQTQIQRQMQARHHQDNQQMLLQQQLHQQRMQIEQMHRSRVEEEETKQLPRKGRHANSQFIRRSSPLPTRVSKRKEATAHIPMYETTPQPITTPAVLRVQAFHGVTARSAPKEKPHTPRSDKAVTPREKQRQAYLMNQMNQMKPAGRASPSRRMKGYSSDFPTPTPHTSRILSGNHQPPKPLDVPRANYRILNTLRNSSPSERLLRPTANSTARSKLRGA